MRNTTSQPEIENPDLFPHILPPDGVAVNESIPTSDEILSVINSQKDNRCQGTDKTYAEHTKYTTSSNLTAAILLLMTMIWTLIEVPKTWLSAAITCLHKKGLKSVAKHYRSIFITSTSLKDKVVSKESFLRLGNIWRR